MTEVVVVTGGAGGIGAAVCQRLARDGFVVAAVDRDADGLRALVQALPGSGHMALDADITDLERHAALVATASDGGPLRGLVATAAVLRRRHDIDEVTEEDWDIQVNTNLKSVFFLDRSVAAQMRAQRSGGSIVNLSSQGWWSGGYGGSVVYAASKGGVVSLTRGLARSLAPHSIRVNVVAPGYVDTPMMRGGMTEAQLDDAIEQVPLGRLATPQEIADACAFLISDESRYMTGATLNVSGGQLMY